MEETMGGGMARASSSWDADLSCEVVPFADGLGVQVLGATDAVAAELRVVREEGGGRLGRAPAVDGEGHVRVPLVAVDGGFRGFLPFGVPLGAQRTDRLLVVLRGPDGSPVMARDLPATWRTVPVWTASERFRPLVGLCRYVLGPDAVLTTARERVLREALGLTDLLDGYEVRKMWEQKVDPSLDGLLRGLSWKLAEFDGQQCLDVVVGVAGAEAASEPYATALAEVARRLGVEPPASTPRPMPSESDAARAAWRAESERARQQHASRTKVAQARRSPPAPRPAAPDRAGGHGKKPGMGGGRAPTPAPAGPPAADELVVEQEEPGLLERWIAQHEPEKKTFQKPSLAWMVVLVAVPTLIAGPLGLLLGIGVVLWLNGRASRT